MLTLNLKTTIKYHKTILCCMALLTVFSVFACNIAVFGFNEMRQSEMINIELASEFSVITGLPFKETVSVCERIIKDNSSKLDSVCLFQKGEPDVCVYLYGGDVISSGHGLKNADDIVIGNVTASKGFDIGDKIKLNSHEYTVCGVRAMRDYDEISHEGISPGSAVFCVYFRWNRVPSETKANKFEKYLYEQFGECEVTSPGSTDIFEGLLRELRTSFIVSGIAACNMVFLFRYLIGIKKNAYSVQFICGASPLRVTLCTLAELTIYSSFGCAAGDILFFLTLYGRQKSAQDFLFVGFAISFFVCIITGFVISFPFLIQTFRKNLLMQEEENA